MITTSWNASKWEGGNGESEVLFSLVLRAKDSAQLSEALSISSRLTCAEAYSTSDEVLDVALTFKSGRDSKSHPEVGRAGFELFQNRPNPFREATLISFILPDATQGTLTIHDVSGRTLHIIRGDFAKGYNEVPLNRNSLPAGVLYYTLETNEHTATRKMILIE
jgi:hypothetical protein